MTSLQETPEKAYFLFLTLVDDSFDIATRMFVFAGGPLAVTDANLILGRLVPQLFPQIFGETEDQPLDVSATRSEFERLMNEVERIIHCIFRLGNCMAGDQQLTGMRL